MRQQREGEVVVGQWRHPSSPNPLLPGGEGYPAALSLKTWGHVLSGLGGGGIFLLFHLGLDAWPSFAVLAGILGFVGLQLVLRADWLAGRVTADELPPGSLAHELVVGAQDRLARLDDLARDADGAMAGRLEHLIAAAVQLMDKVAERPDQAMAARRLLTFYLDTTLRIVTHYEAIRRRRGPADPALARVWPMLDEVERAFARHEDRATAAEVADLETELVVLERTLKAELK